MSDANKTTLTKEVTEAAVLWLEERGFRPVESEVRCAERWVADLASFCYPTRTEAIKAKFVRRRKNGESYQEWNLLYEAIPQPLTAIVEVKTSRGDYRSDIKHTLPPPCNMRYFAMPSGLIDVDDIHPGWGVLLYSPGSGIRQVRTPTICMVNQDRTIGVLSQIALRRDAFTRYERHREFFRQAREHNNERISAQRFGDAVRLVLDVASGKTSVDDALRYRGRHGKLHEYIVRELRELSPVPPTPSVEVV
jgi:hypothetical protein